MGPQADSSLSFVIMTRRQVLLSFLIGVSLVLPFRFTCFLFNPHTPQFPTEPLVACSFLSAIEDYPLFLFPFVAITRDQLLLPPGGPDRLRDSQAFPPVRPTTRPYPPPPLFFVQFVIFFFSLRPTRRPPGLVPSVTKCSLRDPFSICRAPTSCEKVFSCKPSTCIWHRFFLIFFLCFRISISLCSLFAFRPFFFSRGPLLFAPAICPVFVRSSCATPFEFFFFSKARGLSTHPYFRNPLHALHPFLRSFSPIAHAFFFRLFHPYTTVFCRYAFLDVQDGFLPGGYHMITVEAFSSSHLFHVPVPPLRCVLACVLHPPLHT